MVAFSSEVVWSNLRLSGVIGTHQESSEVIRAWWEVRNFAVASGVLGEGNVFFSWQLGWGSGEKVGGECEKVAKKFGGKSGKGVTLQTISRLAGGVILCHTVAVGR